MPKTILEQILEKIADGFIEVGNDMKMLLKIPTPTAEGQVLTAKLVDGELQPVWADGGTSVPNVPNTPNDGLVFDTLTNCEYANGVLNYTSGNLDLTGSAGYEAISANVKSFEITLPITTIYLQIGASTNFGDYQGSGAKGCQFIINDRSVMFNDANNSDMHLPITNTKNDKLQFVLNNDTVTVTNMTTNESFTTDANSYLNKPYLYIIEPSSIAIPIKAIN